MPLWLPNKPSWVCLHCCQNCDYSLWRDTQTNVKRTSSVIDLGVPCKLARLFTQIPGQIVVCAQSPLRLMDERCTRHENQGCLIKKYTWKLAWRKRSRIHTNCCLCCLHFMDECVKDDSLEELKSKSLKLSTQATAPIGYCIIKLEAQS